MYCKYESQEVSSSNIHVMLKCYWNYGSTVHRYFFLSIGGEEIGENDGSDFETLLHFETAFVAE